MADTSVISFSKKYIKSLAGLPSEVQNDYAIKTMLFMQNPNHPSLYVKPWVSGGKASGIMEFRVTLYYRCLYLNLGSNTYLFLYACGHNETNNGKKIGKILTSDPDHGNLELIPDDDTISTLIASIEASLTPEEEKQQSLYSGLSESALRKLRVPEALYKLIRIIRSRDELKKLQDILPDNVFNALDWIADGESVDDVIITLYGDEDPTECQPAGDPIPADPVTKSGFITISTPEDYEKNLAAPLEAWRIFLHPQQRRLAEKQFSGSAKVTGGAGTGKTVTAMHRAKWLAENLPAGKKILFTTFTKNLADDINENLVRLIPDAAVRSRIEVFNLDSWAVNYFNANQKNEHVFYDFKNIWETAYKRNSDPKLTLDFYKEEWERVLLRYEVFDQEGYRNVSRAGRPLLAGGKNKRDEVWQVFQSFIDQCAKKHHLDIGRVMIKCRRMIKESGKVPYEAIVVDEGQDLSVQAYKLLRAMAGPEHPNDLFIVGDTRQRIYQHSQSFSECGINIKGRSSRLRMNYRTTEEIRAAAVKILAGMQFDDMDGENESISGYRSLIHGDAPIIKSFGSDEEEADYIAQYLRSILKRGDELKNVCLAAKSAKLIKRYTWLLKARDISCVELGKSKDDRSVEGLRISSMHRIKGLEFNHIIIAGADNNTIPQRSLFKPDMDEDQKKEVEKMERCLLYVAMTRAKMTALITAPGPMSKFLIENE